MGSLGRYCEQREWQEPHTPSSGKSRDGAGERVGLSVWPRWNLRGRGDSRADEKHRATSQRALKVSFPLLSSCVFFFFPGKDMLLAMACPKI